MEEKRRKKKSAPSQDTKMLKGKNTYKPTKPEQDSPVLTSPKDPPPPPPPWCLVTGSMSEAELQHNQSRNSVYLENGKVVSGQTIHKSTQCHTRVSAENLVQKGNKITKKKQVQERVKSNDGSLNIKRLEPANALNAPLTHHLDDQFES